MVTLVTPLGIVTFSQPRYLPEPSGAQTLPSTLPLKLAPGLFIETVMFISLPADGVDVGVGVGVGDGPATNNTLPLSVRLIKSIFVPLAVISDLPAKVLVILNIALPE